MDYRTKWTVETAVSYLFGVGGRVDIYSNEFNIVNDFKSKEFDPDEELGIWPNQGHALAAYRGMLGLRTVRTANIYIPRTDPGVM